MFFLVQPQTLTKPRNPPRNRLNPKTPQNGPNPRSRFSTPKPLEAGGVEKLGIHWSGHLGENQGMLYLDDAAVTNELLVPLSRV